MIFGRFWHSEKSVNAGLASQLRHGLGSLKLVFRLLLAFIFVQFARAFDFFVQKYCADAKVFVCDIVAVILSKKHHKEEILIFARVSALSTVAA